MSLDSLRNGIVYSMQMNHGTIDSSGQNPAGVNNGATPITTGQKLGSGAYSFDGINDYIQSENIDSITAYTISLWVKRESTLSASRDDMLISKKGVGISSDSNFFIRLGRGKDISNGYIDFGYHDGTSYRTLSTNSVVINNTFFNHIVITYSLGLAKIFINGNLVNSGTLSGTPQTQSSPVYVGRATETSYDGGRHFNGIIDNVNIWNRALSSSEVSELYNSGDGLELFPGVADGVISAYKFDGDATDSALSGNDGTVNGATLTTGKINQGYSFDGELYHNINITGINILSSSDKSFSFWVYPYSLSGSRFLFASQSGFFALILRDINTIDTISFYDTTWIESGVSADLNQWNHIIYTFKGTTAKIYKNGIEILSTSFNAKAISGSTTIGSNWNGGSVLNGIIDEPTIWNRGLSSTEVNELYNSGNGIQYPFIISGYLIKRYNGTSWEEYPVKVYNGTDWVDAKVKRYNGSEWVEL